MAGDFCRDDDVLPSNALDRTTDDFLRVALAIDLRGIDEVHAQLDGPCHCRRTIPIVYVCAPLGPARLPHPEPNLRNANSAPSEFDPLHRSGGTPRSTLKVQPRALRRGPKLEGGKPPPSPA